MDWNQIHDWFDAFYEKYVEGKKPVRGRTFSGSHIEVWGRDNLVIVLHDPYARGNDEESKSVDFVKNMFDSDHQRIYAEIDYARFQRIVSGEQPLTEEDWVWPDED